MTTRIDILQAYNKVSSAIQAANFWFDGRNQCEKAATLLRETALKAIPETSAQTATEIDERNQKAELIANSDGLQLFGSLIPYLLKRQEVARYYTDMPDDQVLEMLTEINKEIIEILNIF